MTPLALHLPDISEYQRVLSVADWHRLFNEQHRRYATSGAAIVRIDYGDAHPDHHLANRKTARDAGAKALGLYQYGVDGQPIHLQTEAFVSLVGALHAGEFAIFDLEEGHGSLRGEAQAWFGDVDKHLTYPGYHGGWLYSGESFIGEHDLTALTAARSTWVAAYGSREPTIRHALWQHTDGQIGDTSCQPWPLIGRVDCSIFHGTVDQLAARVWTPPTPPPAPHPSEEDDMRLYIVDGTKPVWITNGLHRRWVQTPAELAQYERDFGLKPITLPKGSTFLDDIPVVGKVPA